MHRYGIKMNGGKLLWVVADEVECRDGAVLFLRITGESRQITAGFSLSQISHFGLPEAFAQSSSEAAAS